jgi:predicted NBD/HSP70 family sugar kinase
MPDASSLVSGDVRRHNLVLVLDHIIRVGPTSRSEIATGTGLTRGAVTALVQVLIESEWLKETEAVGGAKGRPRTRLEVTADGLALLAIEIAGDAVRVLATTVSGETLIALREDLHSADPETVLGVASRLLTDASATLAEQGRRVVDATVVVLAPVGGAPARLLADAVLGWRDVDVLGRLSEAVSGIEAGALRLVSDAPLAAGAELRRLDGIRDAIYLKGDSNIGGALIVDGAAVGGAHGFGGSLGHLAVVPGGELCACGQHGCLLTVAGVPSLLRAAGAEDELGALPLSDALQELIARVRAGEPRAAQAWADAVPWIGRALRILAMATDPQVIVIGGHWAALSDSITSAFEHDRPEIAGAPGFQVDVRPGVLGDQAGLRGAIEAARDRVVRDLIATRD